MKATAVAGTPDPAPNPAEVATHLITLNQTLDLIRHGENQDTEERGFFDPPPHESLFQQLEQARQWFEGHGLTLVYDPYLKTYVVAPPATH